MIPERHIFQQAMSGVQSPRRARILTAGSCYAAVKELKEFVSQAKPEERIAITGSIWSDEPIKNSIDGKSSVANKVYLVPFVIEDLLYLCVSCCQALLCTTSGRKGVLSNIESKFQL